MLAPLAMLFAVPNSSHLPRPHLPSRWAESMSRTGAAKQKPRHGSRAASSEGEADELDQREQSDELDELDELEDVVGAGFCSGAPLIGRSRPLVIV